MNYRHGFHAGNFADVLKHAIFLACLDELAAAAAPFSVIDTHAGAGIYDLSGVESQKTGEWREGLGRLLDAVDPPPIIARYLAAVRRGQTAGFEGMTLYPGSPRLALQVLRAKDRLTAIELHAPSAALLEAALYGARNAEVVQADGYGALARLVPPRENRGLVLIDPPFETSDEFVRLGAALKVGIDRWETGVFLVWYPVKDGEAVTRFEAEIAGYAVPRLLIASLTVETLSGRMGSCRVMVANASQPLFTALSEALPWLVEKLGRGPGASHALSLLNA